MQKSISHKLNSENQILCHEYKMNMIIQLRIRYDSKDVSCIRFSWIHTNWYEILVIGISLDSVRLRTRLFAFSNTD